MQAPTDFITVVTEAGDTFDTIALEFCGSEMYATAIMSYNPDLVNVVIFGEGTELTVPVYDTGEAPDTLPPWRKADED